ncbi:MAG: elongation factor Ts [Alphaproteobacteria bacterium]|nr:elongation factor Ts [Alphaproteobacteria bacterium]
MTQVTAAMIKDLRESSGAGMLDCKKALEENQGNMEAAIDWLRKKGLSKAAKKSGRTTAEGLVAIAANATETRAVCVEVNSETDFVARNEQFQNFVRDVAQIAAKGPNTVEQLAGTQMGAKNVADTLTEMIATIGENMTLRRMAALEVSQGLVATYMHNAVLPSLGKIGVLVALESSAPADKLRETGKKIAMHIAAAKPEFLDIASVDTAALERERSVLADQARASGKPEDVIQKMVDGRIRKYYEEVVLLEQVFVMDGESKISKVVADASKEAGAPVALKGFVRFALGEGVQKEETDFAAEVAKAANG